MVLLSKLGRPALRTGFRQVSSSTKAAGASSKQKLMMAAGLAGGVAATAALVHHYGRNPAADGLAAMVHGMSPVATASAATAMKPQPNVYSDTKNHALYLWIHLASEANVKQCAKVVANLPKFVDQVCPPSLRDEEDEVWAGVGFGPTTVFQVTGKKAPLNFTYPHRKGVNGEMPSTGGDIFIHAKSNTVSKLFELAQVIQKELPKGSVQKFSDTYSFVYRNGRDLSGFIDGTENAADEDSRFAIAVDAKNGSSYCITQKWIHQLDVINNEKDSTLEGWVGRVREDSTELKKKPATSHVARMTSGAAFGAPKPVEIVRQSMPYGTLGGEAGLFFIGFAKDPGNFEYMLDRMVGADADGHHDNIMKLSKCTEGTYWYFPSAEELKSLR